MRPWRLPWSVSTAPHGLLDVVRGCNISCRECINTREPQLKPLVQVEADLDALTARRRVGSVSIVGGEVTLHPDLPEIVALVKRRGIDVEVLTNGVLLDAQLLERLKGAGTDFVYLHIEGGQSRPDLRPTASPEEVRKLRQEKAALVASFGINVGLTVTAFRGELSAVLEAVRFTLESPHVQFLLVTTYRNVHAIKTIRGDLASGLRGEPAAPRNSPPDDDLTNRDLTALLAGEFDLKPFGLIGSNADPDDPRWVSYLVAAVTTRDRTVWYGMTPSLFERAYLGLYRLAAGRYPMYQRQSAGALRGQALLNGLTGGSLITNARFLGRSLWGEIHAKRLLLQCPAQVDADGRVVHCASCPDAVVQNGHLIPWCISDRVDVDSAWVA